MTKLTIAVVYGGKSTEHEVSVHSAKEVCETLSLKYNVLPILISKEGKWFLQKNCAEKQPKDIEISPMIGTGNLLTKANKTLLVDVFFPVLHGTYGEDGCVQGLFEMMQKPYVGCGVLTSALGMDKEIAKILAKEVSVPILPYFKLTKNEKLNSDKILKDAQKLGYPLFVKPISLGSSIGITKVSKEENLIPAIKKSFKFEPQILVEKGVDNAREVFCGIIATKKVMHTSVCGELIKGKNAFFDYDTKYNTPHGCDMEVPAKLPLEVQNKMRDYTKDIFKILKGHGLARVDFLLSQDGRDIYFSEINTIPGFSHTSLFPQLWAASGKKYEEILDILLAIALEKK